MTKFFEIWAFAQSISTSHILHFWNLGNIYIMAVRIVAGIIFAVIFNNLQTLPSRIQKCYAPRTVICGARIVVFWFEDHPNKNCMVCIYADEKLLALKPCPSSRALNN